MQARAFAPAHITGFFEVFLTDDALTSGSRGAGVTLSEGVFTEVEATPARDGEICVEVNGMPCECEVSKYVAEALLADRKERYEVYIKHKITVPQKQGFGTSAAGALSTVIALNQALNLGMSETALAQVAHRAEVECRTGLGDVIAQVTGGLVVRTRAGAPGIGMVEKFYSCAKVVVFLVGSGIETRKVLSSPEIIDRINHYGKECVAELLRNPGVERFVSLSKKFAFATGLAKGKIAKAIIELEEYGYEASMAMLGEAVFVISEKPEEVVNLLDYPCITASIENCGARLL